FQRNLSDWAEVSAAVTRLARQVAAEVTDRPVARVVVKVRFAPFVTVTHGAALPPGEQSPPGVPGPSGEPLPLGDRPPGGSPARPAEPARHDEPAERWAATIERGAETALAKFTPGRPVRLLGVRAEFADKPG
ncbi:MAG TPA: hypothetical protein VHF26_08765, partial [Trebonia sp.]|nr:hypothetical protein [Trebonia sp.]